MKKNLPKVLIALMLFFLPQISTAQINLGTASNFVLFTTAGAITNSGTNFNTILTGKVGSNSGSSTGFGNVDGTMHSGDPVTIAAAANLATAYVQLNTAPATSFPSSSLGNGGTLVPGVHSIATAATLTGTLTFDALGNPGAVFIVKIGGALAIAANSKVKLVNGALACNIYWKTEGLVSIGSGSYIRGTIVANNAAISMGTLDTLEGRALSLNGAITMNSLKAATPIGCGSPVLTGPVAPTFGAVGIFAIFSSIGPVTNGGAISYVTGDIGTNLGLTTGYNPLHVNGTIHPVPDGATASAAPALGVAHAHLHALPNDIILLYPAIFGHGLVLTPHTYILNAATALTDTVYLDAQGNPNAVFVIKVNGMLSVTSGAHVKLINGTQRQNVYWKVEGAANFANNTTFRGDLVVNNGAIDITSGTNFFGRALTTNGAVTTNGAIINASSSPTAAGIIGDSTVCVGASTILVGIDPGGTWSVTNPRATITSTGILTGVSAGLDTVIYTVNNGLTTSTARKVVNVKPLPNSGTISGPSSVCIGSSITLTSSSPGGVWSANNANATVVNGVVTGITAGTTTISYTVVNDCGTSTATRIITIFTVPTVNTPANQVVCNGTSTAAVNYTGTVPGTTYTWTNNNTSIGLAASGGGNIPAFTVINGTSTPVVATIIVTPSANGCTGSTKTFTITVNPTPNVTVTNQVACNGASTAPVNYAGTVSGTTYAWTNNNTSIGLAASGNGNIPSFTATNGTTAPVIATITVTPSANGCSGNGTNFTFTVNPTPTVDTVPDQVVCNGAPTTVVNHTGTVAGTSYTWTNNNASIGLAATGSGNIPSFTATNVTNFPAVATITVTPSANGCPGSAKSFTITVNPTPNVAAVINQDVCDGMLTAPILYTGPVFNTSFAWTNNTTSIGLAASGDGNIPPFIALNNTDVPVIATITVLPSANNCSGLVRIFTITVNPTPVAPILSLTTPPSVCNMTYFRNFGAATLPPAGIEYTWSTENAAISDTGSTTQYALVNFKNPGKATVILTGTVVNTGCLNTARYDVDVTTDVADVPAKVIYFNKSFVCLQNKEEAYAWGYDDVRTLAPTWLAGEINQDYVNAAPNLDSNNYWVMVTHNGCIQKTYYNKPADAQMKQTPIAISVSPNPATDQIIVGINTISAGDMQIEIYNMHGQRMYLTNSTANSAIVDISSFPAGVYVVIGHHNGETVTARFIKN